MNRFQRAGVLLVAVATTRAGAQRADSLAATAAVYRRFANQVVRIQVVEEGSAAKAGVGSGFFVTPAGHIVTNYHVISRLVTDAGRYRAEETDTQGHTESVTVLAVDVVHDLAILTSNTHPAAYFTLAAITVATGTRLYSLGHPQDLGLSIIEGTYNGLLDYTLYPKIHFTGAINPGMSGGPAITMSGAVVGINVSTEGNEIGFLVPADRARELLAHALDGGYHAPNAFLPVVTRQLRDYQDTYLAPLFSDSTPTVVIGPFVLPTRPAAFFRCWGDATTEGRSATYRRTDHSCSTEDEVFISEDQQSGKITMHHELLESAELNRLRFATLYAAHLGQRKSERNGGEDDFTSYECQTNNVRSNAITIRAAFCIRTYRKLTGLYDASLVVATLGSSDTGLISTLHLSGVSFDNARRAARRFLHLIRWNHT